MTQGLHSALTMYIALAREQINLIDKMLHSGNITSTSIKLIYNSDDMKLLRDFENFYLYDPLKESSDKVEEDYIEAANAMKIYHNLLMSLFAIMSICLYVFMYRPMINRLGQETISAWNLTKLVPQDHANYFEKLTKIVKDKRDLLKWQ